MVTPLVCDHASVGAGPAGVYHLWRFAMDDNLSRGNATTLCLFEQLRRPGGRVATIAQAGPLHDLVVEPGAYRFCPKKVCFRFKGEKICLWTPLITAVVQALGLRSASYNPDPLAWDHALHKIVDADGHDAGFATYVTGMLAQMHQRAAAGHFRFLEFYGHSLQRVAVRRSRAEPTVLELHGRDDRSASSPLTAEVSRSVVLNLPQLPLMRVLTTSNAALPPPPRALHDPNPTAYMKLYLHYRDAWWLGGRYNGLDRRHGNFSNLGVTSRPSGGSVGDIYHFFPGVESPAPLHGSYHDGDVRCAPSDATPSSSPVERCRGYVQAAYTPDTFALMYYRSFGLHAGAVAGTDPLDPPLLINRSSHGSAGSWLLDEVHAALVGYHSSALGPNATDVLHSPGTQPDHAMLAIWDGAASGFGAACHFSRLPLGSKGANATDDAALRVAQHVLRPFRSHGEDRIFVASEAYAPLQCWSEGALQMAENAMQRLGVGRPSWMTPAVYAEAIFADGMAAKDPSNDPLDEGHAAKHDSGERAPAEPEGFARRHSMPATAGVDLMAML